MEFNREIKIIFVLIFIAGMSLGYGIGAQLQYDVIESFLLEQAAAEKPVLIGNGVYELVPYNTVNFSFFNFSEFDKEGAYVR